MTRRRFTAGPILTAVVEPIARLVGFLVTFAAPRRVRP